MTRKKLDLTQQKINAITDIIDNKPVKRMWGGYDPDLVVKQRSVQTNILRREKYALIIAILCIALAWGMQERAQKDATPDKIENARKSSTTSRGATLALSGALGMGLGALIGDRRNRVVMHNETLRHRAEQIVPLMDVLKQRPWTAEELERIKKLSTLTARGDAFEPLPQTLELMVCKMSELDTGYYASDLMNNLILAPTWVNSMICVGHNSRTK